VGVGDFLAGVRFFHQHDFFTMKMVPFTKFLPVGLKVSSNFARVENRNPAGISTGAEAPGSKQEAKRK
jgi:hypothetical protein